MSKITLSKVIGVILMRLSQLQIQTFISSLEQFINTEESVELRLYGSRVHDHLKGGDIDLLIITDSEMLASTLKKQKSSILGKIFSKIDEEKIDILITVRNSIESDLFLSSIYPESKLIYKWN